MKREYRDFKNVKAIIFNKNNYQFSTIFTRV